MKLKQEGMLVLLLERAWKWDFTGGTRWSKAFLSARLKGQQYERSGQSSCSIGGLVLASEFHM